MIRPEIELLLTCARTTIDPQMKQRACSLINGPLDWDYLAAAATRHGLLPLIYRTLYLEFGDVVPSRPFNQVRTIFRANADRNWYWTTELLKIVHVLQANGISALPFKGPTLAQSLYGDLSLRQFGDLDILVRRGDFIRTLDLIVSLGFVPMHQIEGSHEEAFLKSHCASVLVHEENGIRIDLQWGLGWRDISYLLDTDELLDRAEPVTLLGTEVPALIPEHLLEALCLHGTKDVWRKLILVCDVAQFIGKYEAMDWIRLLSRADSRGMGRMVRLGLLLAQDLFGARLPQGARSMIECSRPVRGLAETVKERLLQRLEAQTDQPNMHIFLLKSMQRRSHQVRFLVNLIMRPGLSDLAGPVSGLPRLPANALRPARLLARHCANGMKNWKNKS